MYPDPYRDLAVAFDRLARRPPDWIRHPAFDRFDSLDEIVTSIRDDHPDPTESDATIRALVDLSRHDPSASSVLLHALAAMLRARMRLTVTDEYRADALGDLAAVILEGNAAGIRLAHRYVNRAHNRTHKQSRRVRYHGRTGASTVDPYPTDLVTDMCDRRAPWCDVGDVVADRIDLQRFGAAVVNALASGDLSECVWSTYANHRLRVLYDPDRDPVPTRQRVAAWRAAKKVQPLINNHLAGHAA